MKINYLTLEEDFINQIKKYQEQYDKLFFITQSPILNQNSIVDTIIQIGHHYICPDNE